MILVKEIQELLSKFIDDEIMMRSAALAFYSSFSLAPLILLLTSFLGLLDLDMQNKLLDEVSMLIGPYAQETLSNIIAKAQKRPDLASISGWVAIFLLLLSASVVFGTLKKTLDLIFCEQKTYKQNQTLKKTMLNKIKERFISIGIVLSLIFISIISLSLSTTISYISEFNILFKSELFNIIISLFIFTTIFTLIFRFIPSAILKLKDAFKSGLITAILFVVGKTLIGLYIGKRAFGNAYGPGGSLVALLVWLYYSSVIVFISAEITSIYLKKDKRD